MTTSTLTPKTQINTPVIDRTAIPHQIAYLAINVTDMPKAIEFYKNTLGFAISSESPTWTEISMGITLALKLNDGSCAQNTCSSTKSATPIQNVSKHTGIIFNVQNATKSYETMKSLGVKLCGELMQGCSEGNLKFMFEDPFGNMFSAFGAK